MGSHSIRTVLSIQHKLTKNWREEVLALSSICLNQYTIITTQSILINFSSTLKDNVTHGYPCF